jgi:hypothetical protein
MPANDLRITPGTAQVFELEQTGRRIRTAEDAEALIVGLVKSITDHDLGPGVLLVSPIEGTVGYFTAVSSHRLAADLFGHYFVLSDMPDSLYITVYGAADAEAFQRNVQAIKARASG